MQHRYLILILGFSILMVDFLNSTLFFFTSWLAVNFLILSVGHFFKIYRVLGKKTDGSIGIWSWIIYLPLHFYTIFVWHVYRFINSESSYDKVDENLFIGRRLLCHELNFDYTTYVDLTSEFEEPFRIRSSSGYCSFPILDGSVPNYDDLNLLFSSLNKGRIYIHCAQGHGRTGLVTIAFLLFSKRVNNIEDGYSLIKKIRPKLTLSYEQVDFLKDYEKRANKAIEPTPMLASEQASTGVAHL